jgi:hypothetical protein
VSPVDGDTSMYGHLVSTFQSNMSVSGTDISGTLAYVEGGLDSPLAGDGHFMALQFSSDDWEDYTKIEVGIEPGMGLTDITESVDKNIVVRVFGTQQKFVVKTTKDGVEDTTEYSLTNLTLTPRDIAPVTVAPCDPTDTIYEHVVSSFQQDVAVNGNTITGTLTWVEGGIDPYGYGEDGYYLALQLDSTDWARYSYVQGGFDPPGNAYQDAKSNPDKFVVLKVPENYQDFIILAQGYNAIYDVSGLVLTPHN